MPFCKNCYSLVSGDDKYCFKHKCLLCGKAKLPIKGGNSTLYCEDHVCRNASCCEAFDCVEHSKRAASPIARKPDTWTVMASDITEYSNFIHIGPCSLKEGLYRIKNVVYPICINKDLKPYTLSAARHIRNHLQLHEDC